MIITLYVRLNFLNRIRKRWHHSSPTNMTTHKHMPWAVIYVQWKQAIVYAIFTVNKHIVKKNEKWIFYPRLEDAPTPGLPFVHPKICSFVYQIVHLKHTSCYRTLSSWHAYYHRRQVARTTCVCGVFCIVSILFVVRTTLLFLWGCCELSWASINDRP